MAISDVLETMFFQPVQFVDRQLPLNEWFPDSEFLKVARLEFSGPVSGAYYLFMLPDLAAELTANFLGVSEDGSTDQQQADTIKEALNMIGGHVLSLFDEAGEYQLSIPEMLAGEQRTSVMADDGNRDILLIETDTMQMAAEIRLQ